MGVGVNSLFVISEHVKDATAIASRKRKNTEHFCFNFRIKAIGHNESTYRSVFIFNIQQYFEPDQEFWILFRLF